ncbi:HlyD family secretion protein [Ferrimonas aestuarii]|uniref:Biotin/lipoyl-binding protein n=1 Tax=Ferrimonas aestuarii TaxID=2569539 RepID=A0A4U1BLY1_9GAMM|nr:efflux RND transporter periplasmic adaptor subunit [Ferrimonas aestuarii]TKB54318.1 biotin/lipoyl-binding protein [Ferrimonas aestuarii]
MLEGLAVWAAFIYLLRMIGMPWNKGTKAFAYLGGTGWLMFVWVGLLNYTPMDLSGGTVVQSPHIQLRPANTTIKGKIAKLYVEPNQDVTEGQLLYELDSEPFEIAVERAQATLNAKVAEQAVASEAVNIARSEYLQANQEIKVHANDVIAAKEDLSWKQSQLTRFIEQNRVVKQSVTESQIDEQRNLVEIAKATYANEHVLLEKAKSTAAKAKQNIEMKQQQLNSSEADIAVAKQDLADKQWQLKSTKVYAPTDGFMTNFIAREGQFIGVVARLNMYSNEKYVLMRVNHQAFRNVKVGQTAEFASAVYPGKIFKAEVTGIVRATGESQGNLVGREDNVRQITGANANNKNHFVRLKIEEPEGYAIPAGSAGLAWVSGDRPSSMLGFLDVIRGIIIRMKAQIYYFYSI